MARTGNTFTSSEVIAVTYLAALSASKAVVTDSSGRVISSTATATEVGYLSGVTSGIQAQLNAITSAGYVDGSGTANEIPYWVDSNTLGTLSVATYPSLTELSYVKGVTSAIQTQLNGKQATGNYITSLTGEATASGPGAASVTLTNSAVIGKVLTGYTSGAGTVASTDTILQAIQKLNGNDATNANLTGPITSVGNATSIASQTGTGTTFAMSVSPTISTPVLGTGALGTGLQTDYALVYCSISTAYRGGLLISNAQDSLSTSCSWKINSTFNTARGSAVMSMGFVNNNATETFTTNSAGFMQFADNSGVGSASINVPFSCNSTVNISGVVTMTSPFTLGATSVTTTGTQLNYLNASTGLTGTGSVVLNIDATLGGITKFLGTASTTLTDITSTLRTGSISLVSPYLSDGYSNAYYFSSNTDNPGVPKAGIWAKMTGAGSLLFMGTSNNYASGITNSALIIDYSGNVLVNTTVPKTATGVASIFQVEGTTSNGSSIGIGHNSTTASAVPSLIMNRSRGTSNGSYTLVQNNDYLGGVYFTGADGSACPTGAAILVAVDGTAAANDMPGRLEFWTTPDGSVIPVPRMVINNAGTVTCGTTSGTGAGDFYPGRVILNGNQSFTSASSNAYLYHSTTLGLVMYGNGSTDDFTLAGATGANILSVATGTITARFYGPVNIGGTFTRRTQSGVISQFQMEGTNFDTSSMSLVVNEASNATTAPSILLGRTRGSTVGSNTVVQDGDRVGIILFGGSDGTNNIANAMIQTVVEGTPATGDVGGRLEFLTTQAGVPGPVIRMSINNVGTATFSGAIAINNTVAAGVAVASTHKVTCVIGGTTYYLLASNV